MIDIKSTLKKIKKNDLFRIRKIISSAQDTQVEINKKKYINYSSNNYLNLSNNSDIKKCAIKLMKKYGVGSGSSAVISGYSDQHLSLENYICKLLKVESSVVMNSGYLCNVGVINALTENEVVVVQDKMNHNSIVEGTRLTSCKLVRYKHKDYNNLIQKLEDNKGKNIIIYTDSVFSMTGEIANLEKLSEISKHYKTKLIVDDAHGFGVLRNKDNQFPSSLSLFDKNKLKIDGYIGTFGKAVGTLGSFVAGSNELIELVIQKSKPYIYSTSIPAAIAGATKKSLEIINTDKSLHKKLSLNINFFRNKALKMNLKIANSVTPIQIIKIGCPKKVQQIQKDALNNGLFIQAIRYPTVRKNNDLLRINLSSGHKKSQIEKLLNFLSRL